MSLSIVNERVLLKNERADENQSERYYRLSFSVPEGMGALKVTLKMDTCQTAQVPMILFDARGDVRLMRAANATKGVAKTEYEMMPAHADNGCIPGDIPAGEWKLVLYKRRIYEDIWAWLTVNCERALDMPKETQLLAPEIQALKTHPFCDAVLNREAGWYCGELHTHTDESTGYTSLEEVVEVARQEKLDFLAITDHFTASHWLRLEQVDYSKPPLLLKSVEISGDCGHANVHGAKTWQNPLVDNNEELTAFLNLKNRSSMEQIARQAHQEGALFCINHALSGTLGWRYRDFPLELADLYEVYCSAELDTCSMYTTHWDMLLNRGLHLTGVGSSDSHHPRKSPWVLGKVRTFVYAQSLSQADILSALKRGHAYVSILNVRMDFYAQCGDKVAHMGDTLRLKKGDSVQFTVDLLSHPRGNLFLYADGMLLDTEYFDEAGRHTYTFALKDDFLKPGKASYIRMDFYELVEEPRFYGMAFRDYKTLRLISNPIWLDKEE